MIHFCHLKENRAGNMTNVNKVMDSNQILQNFDRQKWMYSFNYCQMTCDISVICCLMCVSQKKCFAAFWFGNLHIPDSKNCTSHTATDHVLSSVASHFPDTVSKATPTPCCLWTPNKGLLHLCFLVLKSQDWLQNWNSLSLVTENLIRCSSIAAVQITFLTNTTSFQLLNLLHKCWK